MDILEKFKEEIQNDVKVDELNLLEKQMQLPAIKHKWVARLIDFKRKINALERKKKSLREEIYENYKAKGIPPNIPKGVIEKKIDTCDSMLKLQEELDENKIMVEYLEKVEVIFKNMSFDMKNIVDITKMETT